MRHIKYLDDVGQHAAHTETEAETYIGIPKEWLGSEVGRVWVADWLGLVMCVTLETREAYRGRRCGSRRSCDGNPVTRPP